MKLLKIEKVTSDAIVANTPFFIDVEDVNDIAVGATTCVVSGPFGAVTFTVDGADADEKLLNATKIADHIAGLMQDMTGPHSTQKGIVELFRGQSYANFETDTGIVNTGSTGPLVTTALS